MTTVRTLAVVLLLLVSACRHRPVASPRLPPATLPPTQERCGNCVDDDGDGRVDFEDTDCCPHPAALEGATLTVEPAASPQSRDAFTLMARIPAGALTAPNPFVDDVSVQVRAGTRSLVCAHIGHQFWTKQGETYRFRPRGTPATHGLPETFVRVLPGGAVAVRVTGERGGLARQPEATWQVTVRIGDGCAAGTARSTVGASSP